MNKVEVNRVLPAVGRSVLVLWFLLPLIPVILWAISNRWSFPGSVPQEWGFDGVRSALDAGGFDAFVRSTLLALAVAAIATPLGALAARALVNGNVRFPAFVAGVLFAPLALPPFAVALGLDVLVLRSRIPSTVAVIALLTVAAIPYTTYLMRVAFGAYDIGYEEEARTLGASSAMVLRRIRIPLLAPALAGAALLAFLVAWSDYVITLLIGGGRLVTVPILVASFAAGTGNDSVVAALSVTAVVPPLLLVLMLARLRRRSAR
ncbi:ABC transporter permease [Rhodococcoides fascians]|uniref:ABC transporter permease n=1 Tax=Rhodococcoides fascians TaxID=1828 RepID=UPI001D42D609|nr:ABC transporter permease subunit [Rhodococcus fascians]CAH0135697.1 Putative 2-aminoethylphosphonate transport system permease protein PhnV [Rhodococcus fascians]